MASPNEDLIVLIHQEAKAAARRSRVLLQLAARLKEREVDNQTQSEEDTENDRTQNPHH